MRINNDEYFNKVIADNDIVEETITSTTTALPEVFTTSYIDITIPVNSGSNSEVLKEKVKEVIDKIVTSAEITTVEPPIDNDSSEDLNNNESQLDNASTVSTYCIYFWKGALFCKLYCNFNYINFFYFFQDSAASTTLSLSIPKLSNNMDAETLEQKMKELVVAITERLESSTDKGIIDSATNKINLIIDELDSETTEKSSITVSTKLGIFATQKN